MNKAGMFDSIVYYVMSQPFLLFIDEEGTKMAAPFQAKFENKEKKKESIYGVKMFIEQLYRVCKWKILLVLGIFKAACIFACFSFLLI